MNSGQEAFERSVRVILNTIENIVRRDSVTITIVVYHGENLLGESDPLRIEPDFHEPATIYPIDYRTSFSIIVTDRSIIDSAISTPLLCENQHNNLRMKSGVQARFGVQIVEHENDGDSRPVSSAADDDKKRDKTKSGRKSVVSKGPKIIGLCNIDIIPILLGEKNFVERLIVEEPKPFSTASGTSWLNLPILTVTLIQEEINFLPPDLLVNYLGITVESIHNSPLFFTESLEYKAATIVYIDDEEPEIVIFDGGKFSKYRDVELTKRWRTLSKLEGRGGLSKYKIDCDYGSTKNPLENFDFKKIIEKDNPRIEWNYFSRHILLPGGQEIMREKLNKYRNWPFQFRITSNVSESGKSKSKDSSPQLYQCYADMSELLYPGRTHTRTLAQLYSFNAPEMMEKTGFDKSLFKDVNSEVKSKDKKGKLGTKGSSTNLASMEFESISSTPITNEAGEPVFVVIQFELHEPIVPSRTTEKIIDDLHELLGPPDKLSPYPYTGDLAEEQYINCIRKLVETIIESYRDFNDEDEKTEIPFPGSPSRSGESAVPGKKYSYIPDEIDRFTQYLYETGTYVAVQTTLKKKIVRLLDQKFKMQSCTWDSEECQNFVANAYLYLVEQMHVALNSENDFDDETFTSTDNLCYCAEESYELGNITQAKNNYISVRVSFKARAKLNSLRMKSAVQLITVKRGDPEAWLKYAIFLKKIGDVERAVQCCREAINLDSRHKLALLLYGVILAEKEDYSAAEIFLKATAQLYPRFAEIWIILHLFYLRTEYFPGVDLTIRVGEQCLLDQNRDTVHMDCMENEPLAWSTIHCPKNRVYLIAVVFLLKLNLYDFAGIALAQELSLAGRSTSWLYYMAVHHYLLERYDDALTHLKEAQNMHGMDYSIAGLMGHCYFKIDEIKSAMECYDFASTLFDRPVDIHLIDIRMGNYSLEAEEYSRGKTIFLNVCKSSPTSSSWLGLGIACFHMMDFNDAETALNEANRLDHTNPEVWAYLCLLNMSLQRYDEFTECYRQTVKNDLQKAKLWLLITNTMESLGLSSPMLLTTETQHTIVKETSAKLSSELEDSRISDKIQNVVI